MAQRAIPYLRTACGLALLAPSIHPLRMKRGLAVLLLALLPAAALADGGVYIHNTAFQKQISIPDQRALLCWSNGVERLAI